MHPLHSTSPSISEIWAASRVLASVGLPLPMSTGAILMGRGSPGGSLLAHSAAHSAACRTMVWWHGCAVVYVVAQYHPFRWQQASCPSPPASLRSIEAPTTAVWASQSGFNVAYICHCIPQPVVMLSHPVRRSIMRWLIRAHILSKIHLFPLQLFWSSLLSASKSQVKSSCGSGGSCMGRR